jgi:hypothetical protein
MVDALRDCACFVNLFRIFALSDNEHIGFRLGYVALPSLALHTVPLFCRPFLASHGAACDRDNLVSVHRVRYVAAFLDHHLLSPWFALLIRFAIHSAHGTATAFPSIR